MGRGKILLLPNLLDETLESVERFFPPSVSEVVSSLEGLIAESEKMGRRYLRKFVSHEQMAKTPLKVLNEHSRDLDDLLAGMREGQTWGLISDAGLPCIADPGSDLVWRAHEEGICVEAFVGPSSIIMALQLCGFYAQSFTFHGYLPREVPQLEQKIKEMERQKGTHIWIEAPYRSAKMLELLKKELHPNTRLCVAASLTGEKEKVLSLTMAKFKKHPFSLEKEPAVFVINAL